jgi:phosphoribosylformimino-5-aminoimidazole carboxamide ribotide isomerase
MAQWVDTLGAERLVVGVDARDGRVATHGWANVVNEDVLSFCQRLVGLGVRRVVYTDVGRDGVLGGPNVTMTREISRMMAVIGSGGVATVQDLHALAEAGAEGAIVGTALYEGRLTLGQALDAAC